LPDESPALEPSDHWTEELEAEEDEPWRESLPSPLCDNDEDEDFAERRHHPLQQRALDLMLRLHKLLGSETEAADSHQDILLHGAGDMLGGLAQALGGLSQFSSDGAPTEGWSGTVSFPVSDFQPAPGLSVVQLKRALRGAAFALGALFPLRANGALEQAAFDELHNTIQQLQTDVFAELSRLRQRREDESTGA